jgi:hypothetical protein
VQHRLRRESLEAIFGAQWFVRPLVNAAGNAAGRFEVDPNTTTIVGYYDQQQLLKVEMVFHRYNAAGKQLGYSEKPT